MTGDFSTYVTLAGGMGFSRSRARYWAVRLTLAVVSVAVAAGVCEIALRLTGRGEAAPAFAALFTPDDQIGYRPRPGARARITTPEFDTTIEINGDGVRGSELQAKAPGEFRILVLGDSMVFAAQVPVHQTFCQLLEDQLNARASGLRIRVINGGVQGYGPIEERLFFSRVAARVQPDLVLAAIFAGNDVVEAADGAARLARRRSPVSALGERARASVIRLARRSAVLQFVRLRVLATLGRSGTAPLRDRPLEAYFAQPPAEAASGFEITREAVAAVATEASGRGARTAIVLMPARFQLDADDYSRLAAEMRRRGAVLTRDGSTERLRAVLGDLELPLLDLLPVFRAAPAPAALFYQGNIHLTPRGHVLVAETLAGFLRAHELVPRDAAARSPGDSVNRSQFVSSRRRKPQVSKYTISRRLMRTWLAL